MAKQASGDILHFNGIRLRITGFGNLKQLFASLQNVTTFDIVDLPLLAATNRDQFVLANFRDQYGQVRFGTTEIGETFTISRMVIYVNPVATGYPQ